MSERLTLLYGSRGMDDMAKLSDALVDRYASFGAERFLKLVMAKYALIDRLSIANAAKPFSLDEVALEGSREFQEKRQRLEPGVSVKAKEETYTELEIRVKDHHGKSRVTKARPGTTMGEIVDWYGPRNGRAYVVDQQTNQSLRSDDSLRKLVVSGNKLPLDLKIVAK